MIQISPQMRILVAVESVDSRNGIDGLVRLCEQTLGSDPFCGWLFVFANRGRTAVKISVYDQQGFWCCQNFRYWPTAVEASKVLEAHELQLLLVGGNPSTAQAVPAWRRLPMSREKNRTTAGIKTINPACGIGLGFRNADC